MELGETADWDGNGLGADMEVAVNLPMLLIQTFLGPSRYLLGHCVAAQNRNITNDKKKNIPERETGCKELKIITK